MPVLREELGDGDLALARAHLDGRDGGLERGRLRFGRGGGLVCGGRGGRLGAALVTTGLGQWRSRRFAYTPHISTCFVIGRYLVETEPSASTHTERRETLP